MVYNEDDFLNISGLQHFCFCRRQWALIHIEHLWQDNLKTIEGNILHENAHDSSSKERRGELLIARNVRVFSPVLRISGNCDVVEFRICANGVPIHGQTGLWQPFPIEYKHGSPRKDHANELQLCAQAMCLEEMLCCEVPSGALYFGETRHREKIVFTPELRQEVKTNLTEMHHLYEKQYTPKVKPSKSCNACSLKELCVPRLMRKRSVHTYLTEHLEVEQ